MPYTIRKEGVDKEECGYDILYDIHMKFEKQQCFVQLEIDNDFPKRLRVNSVTDGYHWLHFFLAQQPGCLVISEKSRTEEKDTIKQLFASFEFRYEPEDKESCFLESSTEVSESQIEVVASIIHDRFANRERFFE